MASRSRTWTNYRSGTGGRGLPSCSERVYALCCRVGLRKHLRNSQGAGRRAVRGTRCVVCGVQTFRGRGGEGDRGGEGELLPGSGSFALSQSNFVTPIDVTFHAVFRSTIYGSGPRPGISTMEGKAHLRRTATRGTLRMIWRRHLMRRPRVTANPNLLGSAA